MGFSDFRDACRNTDFLWGKHFYGSSYALYLREKFLQKQKENSPDSYLLIMESEDEARKKVSELSAFDLPILYYPAYDRLESELLPPNALTVFERLKCLKSLCREKQQILLLSEEALEQKTISAKRFKELSLHFQVEEDYKRDKILHKLNYLGYRREEMVATRGEFAVRGDIIDIFPSTEEFPSRLEFFGDELESIRKLDLYTQRSTEKREELLIHCVQEFDPDNNELISDIPEEVKSFLESSSKKADFLQNPGYDLSGAVWLNNYLKESVPVTSYCRSWQKPKRKKPPFTISGALYFSKNMDIFLQTIAGKILDGFQVLLFLPKAGFALRVQKLLEDRDIPVRKNHSIDGNFGKKPGVFILSESLSRGFEVPDLKFCAFTYGDFTGTEYHKPGKKSAPVFTGDVLHHFSELQTGDFVVHVEHGIARFTGMSNLLVEGVRKEYLTLEYEGGDRVYVPITEVDRISRFGETDGRPPRLNRLNSVRWKQVKSRVKEELQIFARDLLQLYAKRELATGFSFNTDNELVEEMEAGFEHEDTPDQIRAMAEIKEDMENQLPMERLLCGDVGFGKTEMAVRAAFKAIQDKKQVAVLCPTTILSQQHFQTFSSRLFGSGVRVEVLNRFVSTKETAGILKDLSDRKVDILIGTHSLLSKKVRFADLGLLIIDEEQRFGVKHKEKLREIKANIDTLTLSATPIPRTLHMSLGGVRKISVIHTPPPGRLPVKTFVLPYQPKTVRSAIERELKRGGQVFYVYNRIDFITNKANELLNLIPGLKIRYLHGRMDAAKIEEVMSSFLRREFDILLTTTIIESGMDIPNVNTIIVERADAFGLAQLYQLRGRIGRRELQGFAYLFYSERNELTDIAAKRLSALEEFTDLGSGFKIAMRDLEIRGAGSLLGKQQSGQIHKIGFDLYARLLQDTIEQLKDSGYRGERELPQLDMKTSLFVRDEYIPSYRQRMDIFRRLSFLKSPEGLEDLKQEIFDRYGPFPKEMLGVFRIIELRIFAYKCGVKRIQHSGIRVVTDFHEALSREFQDYARRHYGKFVDFSFRFPERMSLNTPAMNANEVVESLLEFFQKYNQA
jgi:transcription-repair coupling factor (superfamily II helicase)